MRKRALLLLCLLAGCGSAADRLVGTWVLDIATLELIPRFREMSAEIRRRSLKSHRFELTFTKDLLRWEQKMYGWGDASMQGPYTVRRTEGNRVDVTYEPNGAGKRKLTFTVQENRLRFPLKGRSIILKRKV